MNAVDRRRFMEMTLGAAVSCAGIGCASMATARVTPTDGRIRLALADYPALQGSSGFLRVQSDGFPSPLYVLATPEGSYVTVSPICTHRGCTVDVVGPDLVCPCHGSTYDRTGGVLEGPAQRPLDSFPTRLDQDGVLWIRVDS